MSKETKTIEMTDEEITDRAKAAYLASGCILINDGEDQIVMISGKSGDKQIDLLVAMKPLVEMIERLKSTND